MDGARSNVACGHLMKGTVLECHDTEGAGKLGLQLPVGLHISKWIVFLSKKTRTSEFQEAELSKLDCNPPAASNRRFHQLGLPPAKHDAQASRALPHMAICSFNAQHYTHRLAFLQVCS